MDALLTKLRQIIEPILEENAVDLVDLEVRGSKRNLLLRVFVDVPGGISINECVRLSREFEDAIEMENLIPGPYRLEVSSPGIDRPLKTERDFQRNIGRLVEIQILKEDKLQKVRGDILSAEKDHVKIQQEDGDIVEFPISAIHKALIQIKW
ncbi:MAG: ribosome maturation factor RimP [candidate division KSB1 bacterium]|nr:ribosome maturation factor RimP [candidate division KSB1 bacterium]MDQ7062734.1 ribosome maturation factor RimP [candidate division KSB1 bacterium]